ncbi:hypothetical protein [Kitasatospora sp. NPDC059571]|uniref:hypothetical protein n=1 Tax=Kitasatospora sp. NPDC059571 TaxID=3346871 RepID=UPI0036B0643C
MNKRLLTVPVLGALLAFGTVACSSDNSAALDSWAKGVCDAAKDPITQSRAALADTAKVIPGEAPADLQKRLSTDLAGLAKANQGLADAVDKAGAPKSDDGATSQKEAVDELRKAAQGYLDVQKKLNALATMDQAKFADGLRSVGDQVQQVAQLSTNGLNRLQTGEIGDAVKRQPGCKAGALPAGADGASPGASAPVAPEGSVAPSLSHSGANPSGSAQSGKPSASASASAGTSAAPGASSSGSADPSASAG